MFSSCSSSFFPYCRIITDIFYNSFCMDSLEKVLALYELTVIF